MTEEEAKPYAKPIPHWIPETRTVIVCWMMVSTFFIIVLLMLIGTPKGDNGQLLNTLLGMYVGSGLIMSVQWWMGSAKGSDADNKMKDSMADAVRPAVLPAPVATAWWNRMTEAERAAITASTDPKVVAFVAAPVSAVPLPDDLAMLVAKGLLTKERADAIKAGQ